MNKEKELPMKFHDYKEAFDHYAGQKFVEWSEENGVDLENVDDWSFMWRCWKTAYIACMNGY